MRKKKYILYFAAAAAAAGLGLGACSPGTGTQKETASSVSAGQQTAVSGVSESGTESETGYGNGHETGHETRHETRHETELGTEVGTASEHTTEHIPEHIPEQEAAKAPVLRLKLPDDVTVCSSPVMIQEDEHTVQIQFHDENTQSDAMAWASLEAGGGPSEYYVLDEEGTLQQEVWAGEKLVKMTIQKTVENSDIHGILVSWEHEGVFYELWEDDARDSMDAVIEMASAIAVRSAAVQGN